MPCFVPACHCRPRLSFSNPLLQQIVGRNFSCLVPLLPILARSLRLRIPHRPCSCLYICCPEKPFRRLLELHRFGQSKDLVLCFGHLLHRRKLVALVHLSPRLAEKVLSVYQHAQPHCQSTRDDLEGFSFDCLRHLRHPPHHTRLFLLHHPKRCQCRRVPTGPKLRLATTDRGRPTSFESDPGLREMTTSDSRHPSWYLGYSVAARDRTEGGCFRPIAFVLPGP
mmetsp:Transcript_14538/g.30068  ORF Transcript_14538/g.30068 Transcript_14538/m.30068 type:complete len:224 (+) Transcript_14538:172-843(+)